ncbi:Hypothetical predicted protein [Pelobates cultripes]|uniref:Uncharacterized protein n=1 Tax=Pelobates cultripes TaxID=61616 RepID=A0AAD1SVB6_PELCU|nr:Hypothetical predicted protein [Pelobates cultripes]
MTTLLSRRGYRRFRSQRRHISGRANHVRSEEMSYFWNNMKRNQTGASLPPKIGAYDITCVIQNLDGEGSLCVRWLYTPGKIKVNFICQGLKLKFILFRTEPGGSI